MLEKSIGGSGREAAHGSIMTCTLRKWKGAVAREEGDWAAARFEFLQGRSLAETYDPGNVPWFDAAITEAEIWEAFGTVGLELDGLKELTEKLDRTSGLYGMAGDRLNEEFTEDWARWFGFFLVPAVPSHSLVGRILAEVRRPNPRTSPGETAPRSPYGNYVFMWNHFWFSGLARRTTIVLRALLGGRSTLDELMRGASVLAPPKGSLGPMLNPRVYLRDQAPPSAEEQLTERITSELDAFRVVERDAEEYVTEVKRSWEAANHQKRMEVEHALHPRKQRR